MEHKNIITWEQYKVICDKYSHVTSFAYWTKNHKGNEAKELISDNEMDYNNRVKPNIHADVIILGINFGTFGNFHNDKNIEKELDGKTIDERVEHLKKLNYLTNQHGARYGKKALYEAFQNSYVEGAYLTDLFKYDESEDKNDWKAAGIPTKTAVDLERLLKSDTENVIIKHNVEGLYHELYNDVKITHKPIFVLMMGGFLTKFPEIKKVLSDKFDNPAIYNFSHYQRTSQRVDGVNKGWKKQDFVEQAKPIIESIQNL